MEGILLDFEFLKKYSFLGQLGLQLQAFLSTLAMAYSNLFEFLLYIL
jgi:hypothetical protein